MSYEIVMPQLSDSMDEGKLISWKVQEGQKVNAGDVVAEVESDKAIMEVQSFQSGVVSELRRSEGDTIPVGEVIATIESKKSESVEKKSEKVVKEPKSVTAEKSPVQKPEPKPIVTKIPETKPKPKVALSKHISKDEAIAISPKARAKVAQYGVDAQRVMQKTSKSVLHVEDVEVYLREHYFTPKALELFDKYGLNITTFELNHKIDETEVQEYIQSNKTPLPQPLTQMQKAIINNVTLSAQKPVYHLYEHIDAKLFLEHKEYSMTAWLLKIFAKVMMMHDSFRTTLQNDALILSPNASISVAVADAKNLYMPVIKDANQRSVEEIATELATFKTKLQEQSFSAKDMQGSTFGVSNLGMLGVESFDAMLNKDDVAIIAVGGIKDGKISVTLTADHRLINGYEAGLFMRDIKQEASNPLQFKE